MRHKEVRHPDGPPFSPAGRGIWRGLHVHSYAARKVPPSAELLRGFGMTQSGHELELGFVVRAGLVDGNAAEVFGHLDQPLVVLIPFSRGFIQHHYALECKSELNKSGFA